MSSSATVAELCAQLRLLLDASPDAVSLSELLARVDAFVLECSASPEAGSLLHQLEDELQVIYDDDVGHALFPQAEIFLAFLYHLRPVLPSSSIISTWFDLVLRPTLREPKLPLPAVNYAKELIISALDPGSNFSATEVDPAEVEKQRERVGDFRRRLMDLYLLDAFNESSGDDVLEWAELDEKQREKKACWKANLEDVLVRVALERPQDFLTELYHCFISPTSRLQLLILLNAYTSQPAFADHADVLAAHPLMTSLLHSLAFDNSSTVCTIALSVLVKLLPILAVKACESLKRLLPHLLVVLARILCWKERQSSSPIIPVLPDPEESDEEDAHTSDDERDVVQEGSRPLPIREDIEWDRLELTFDGPASKAPSPHRYFTFLYYLFPCNTIRFLRYPVRYLNDNAVDSLYAVDWEEALDEDKIRSKVEPLLRRHVLHPLLIWREAKEELEQPDFWAQYDIPQIVGGATMLDVRNAALGLRQQPRGRGPPGAKPQSPERVSSPLPVEDTDVPLKEAADSIPLSSSLETVHPEAEAEAGPSSPVVPRISLTDMVATSVALKSGLEVEIVDPSPAWSAALFPVQPRTRSTSREKRSSSQPAEEHSESPVTPAQSEHETSGDGSLPRHVAQAISALQREVLLLKNDLNLELWTTRENVKHIGRLYKERVLSRNEEVERQGLHNKLKEYKHTVTRLRQELKEAKEQAIAARTRYTDWNRELQDRIAGLRAEKKAWTNEAAGMRAAEKEAKDTFAAQGQLLAEANQLVFHLETKMKENAHKVDRLHDYETQIDQLIKLQRLWESDVHKINDSKEYLAAFASKYRKMELRLDAVDNMQSDMEHNAASQRQRILELENTVEWYRKELEGARKDAELQRRNLGLAEYREIQNANERLRTENEELRDEIEEVNAMVEQLRAQVSGRQGLVSLSSPRASPT
ncbi:Hamartin protein-domain-containing protein [Trametes elegans]|nr:Hamartin protein-domain-containing protein [Trametes elegans]